MDELRISFGHEPVQGSAGKEAARLPVRQQMVTGERVPVGTIGGEMRLHGTLGLGREVFRERSHGARHALLRPERHGCEMEHA